MMLDIIESNKFRTQSDFGKVLGLGDTAISKYLKEMSFAKAGGNHLGRTSKDVMKKVRQTLSDVKKSSKMYPDEVVLEEARKWFHERWKITLAGEKTNKRLVDIEQLEDQNPDF